MGEITCGTSGWQGIIVEDSAFALQPSGTEPVARRSAEVSTEWQLQALTAEGKAVIGVVSHH